MTMEELGRSLGDLACGVNVQRRPIARPSFPDLFRSPLSAPLGTAGCAAARTRIGLRVIERGIDTTTAEGRIMFGMLSVLAELQRELIVANTGDGLAAARVRQPSGDPNSPLRRPTKSHAIVRICVLWTESKI